MSGFRTRRKFIFESAGAAAGLVLAGATPALSARAKEAPPTMTDTGKHVEPLGFTEHPIRVGNGKGGWRLTAGEVQFLHCRDADHLMPFGVQHMDNGEVLLLASAERPGQFTPVVAFSRDDGATWSDWARVREAGTATDANGRPMMLTYLGQGRITFHTDPTVRFTSTDYGRTWERIAVTFPRPEDALIVEGNAHVDRDPQGNATRIAAVGYKVADSARWPESFTGFLQWSTDGGKTWGAEVRPKTWVVEFEHHGQTVVRGVSEGSIVRARNGDLVAALRTDMPPRFYRDGAQSGTDFDDSLEGLGVSTSHDNGKTWSPISLLYEAGRHHPHLMALPNGDLIMTYIVRVDVRGGGLASCRRGCEALVGHDHGQTWRPDRRYMLDEFEFFDGVKWFNGETGHLGSTALPDGRLLTAYGRYQAKAACLIRWRP